MAPQGSFVVSILTSLKHEISFPMLRAVRPKNRASSQAGIFPLFTPLLHQRGFSPRTSKTFPRFIEGFPKEEKKKKTQELCSFFFLVKVTSFPESKTYSIH